MESSDINEESLGLGVKFHSQNELEDKVFQEADSWVKARERERINALLSSIDAKKENIEKQIEQAQREMGKGGTLRKIQMLTGRLSELHKKLADLSEQSGELLNCLLNDSQPQDGENQIGDTEEKPSQSSVDEMIRLGMMTPFGTTLSVSASSTKKTTDPRATKIKKNKGRKADVIEDVKNHQIDAKSVGDSLEEEDNSIEEEDVTVNEKDDIIKEEDDSLKEEEDSIKEEGEYSDEDYVVEEDTVSDEEYLPTTSKKSSKEILEKYLERQLKMHEEKKVKAKEKKRKKKSTLKTKKATQLKSPLKKSILKPKKAPRQIAVGSEISDGPVDWRVTPATQPGEWATMDVEDHIDGSESEYLPSDEEDPHEGYEMNEVKVSKRKGEGGPSSKRSKVNKELDDGNIDLFVKRVAQWKHDQLSQQEEKWDRRYETFEGGYKIPNKVWRQLYGYQKVCVRWLWELHQQRCGGIIGDEMGLGKTFQVIAYLKGFHDSKIQDVDFLKYNGLGPVLVVAPTTVMYHWVKEFHTWWPEIRVAILHESGSFSGSKVKLIYSIQKTGGVVVTSYQHVVKYSQQLTTCDWHYVILDEGHKIRNPNSQATVAVKQFSTPHRIILSGSPLQNNLKELWSLFDFVYPGKLGTLQTFMEQFSVPITQGGYSNASQVQVVTAYKCATTLRDTISPYLIRRMKADVKQHLDLPDKNEQVLFCQLTDEQKRIYKDYIESNEVDNILSGRLKVYVGLINLRKVCNHPDLYTGGPKLFTFTDESTLTPEEKFGYWRRSGKMVVLESLLKLWHKQNHKVLLFAQGQQMLCVIENFVQQENYTYLRMDGRTSISARQGVIAKFNQSPDIFVFLLTTRVGGLGINLTGADRVIIFDPDWNPSTDMQARERAWRIGQSRPVTIYRLLTSGTIEEKIYHRQIFKQFLCNRVLKDPKQQRFFKSNDLFELFTFTEGDKEKTETSAIFAGTGSEVKVKKRKKRLTQSVRDKAEKLGVVQIKDKAADKIEKERAASVAEKSGLQRRTEVTHKPSSVATTSQKRAHDETTREPSKKKHRYTLVEGGNIEEKERDKSREEKDRHKRKKSKKKKYVRVDGEVIKNAVKLDVCAKNEEEEEDKAVQSKMQDDYVLERLFKKSGVHTAMQHDVIEKASNPDYAIVEAEADRVARDAIKAVRMSRKQCVFPSKKPKFGKKANSFLQSPSSSGGSSSKFSPKSKKMFDGGLEDKSKAMSSADLIQRLEKQNALLRASPERTVDDDDDVGVDARDIPNVSDEHKDLLIDIRSFIAFRGRTDGEATTAELLEHFKQRVAAKDSALFKSLLNKICNFYRDTSNKQGVWRLKIEFR